MENIRRKNPLKNGPVTLLMNDCSSIIVLKDSLIIIILNKKIAVDFDFDFDFVEMIWMKIHVFH